MADINVADRACVNNPCPETDDCFPSSEEPGRYCRRKHNVWWSLHWAVRPVTATV